jgi:hypothetical protein
MEFASEMIVKAALGSMNITEVPTTLSPDGRSRPPHLRSWRDGWRHLRFLLLYSPRWLFMYPGLALMAVGLLTGLWLLPGPRTIGGISLDVHTLLYAATAVVVGFQAVTFAVFTKIFAISERLLPEDPRLVKLYRYVTLEVGLIIGGVFLLIGLLASIWAFSSWSSRSFGALDSSTVLRIVTPSITMIILGVQTVLSSFFLSILGLRRR